MMGYIGVNGRNIPPELVSPYERVFFGGSRATIGYGRIISVNQTNNTYTIDLGEGVFTFSYIPGQTYFAFFNTTAANLDGRYPPTASCNILIPGTIVSIFVQKLENGAFTTGAWQ
jgi:hypothetical protein